MCTIVHKCLHAAAPPHLSELCIPVSTSAARSSSTTPVRTVYTSLHQRCTQQLQHTCQNCVYQSPPALHAAAPPYLSELCIPVSTSAGRHFLRSATYGDLLVPRTSTSTYGPRSFAVSGPSVWNKLPATLRVSPTLGQFQSKLKAVLFRSAYETWLDAFVTA